MYTKVVLVCAIFSLSFFAGCSDTPVKVNENWSSNTATISVPVGISSAVILPPSSATGVSSPSAVYYHSLPAVANPTIANSLYLKWKGLYYRSAAQEAALGQDAALAPYYAAEVKASARIMWDKSDCDYQGQCTVSEGIGYGMILAYFANDAEAFTALWLYHKYFRISSGAIMDWKVKTFYSTKGGDASATDADLDVATALLLGYQKWQNPALLADAQLVMKGIWELEIDPNYAIRPGNTQPWNDGTRNPSYFSPVAFRLFAQYDANPAHNWLGALEYNYNWMYAMNAKGAGLFPDWANDAGDAQKPSTGVANGTFSKYYLEAIRVPWRLAWDYAWFGDARAKAILDRMANYIVTNTGGDITKILDRYPFIGPPITAGVARLGQTASFCAVGLANPAYATWTNNCTNFLNSQTIDTFDYFNDIIMLLYLQLMNGLVVK